MKAGGSPRGGQQQQCWGTWLWPFPRQPFLPSRTMPTIAHSSEAPEVPLCMQLELSSLTGCTAGPPLYINRAPDLSLASPRGRVRVGIPPGNPWSSSCHSGLQAACRFLISAGSLLPVEKLGAAPDPSVVWVNSRKCFQGPVREAPWPFLEVFPASHTERVNKIW